MFQEKNASRIFHLLREKYMINIKAFYNLSTLTFFVSNSGLPLTQCICYDGIQ